MGRLFDSPFALILILLVILLLFGGPKLPGMARSMGQSMRIFKSEVQEMKRDDQAANVTVDGQPVADGQRIAPPQHPAQGPGTAQSSGGAAPGQHPAGPATPPADAPADPRRGA